MTMKICCCIAILSLCLAGVATSQNLIRNGAAELGTGGNGFQLFQIPEWVVTTSSAPTTTRYSPNTGSFPMLTDPGVVNPGRQFFSGGPNTLMSSMQKTHDISSGAGMIDTGGVSYTLSGDLGGFASDGDNVQVHGVFFDASYGSLGSTSTLGPVTPAQRGNVTGFVYQTVTGPVPVGTRLLVVIVTFNRTTGSYCDGYLDNLSLVLSPDPLTHPYPNGGPCGAGTIGASATYPAFDVLHIGFEAGGVHRAVALSVGQNLGISLNNAYPGATSAHFALFAIVDGGTYSPSDVTFLGPSIGTMCIPILNGDPRGFILADSLGLGGLLPLPPAPVGTTILGGVPVPFSLVVQGLMLSPTGSIDITNAIHLTIQ